MLKFAEEPGGGEKGVESIGQGGIGLGLDEEGEITGVSSIHRSNRKKSIHAIDMVEETKRKRYEEEMKRQQNASVKVSINAMASLAMFTSELNARMDDRRTSFQRRGGDDDSIVSSYGGSQAGDRPTTAPVHRNNFDFNRSLAETEWFYREWFYRLFFFFFFFFFFFSIVIANSFLTHPRTHFLTSLTPPTHPLTHPINTSYHPL